MDMETLEKALQIRYVKLHFTLRLLEDAHLPMNKPSAIRGGIGEMLLNANCIRDRNCSSCDFESECLVRRTMYSKFERKPEFVTDGDSVGYVLECENYETDFRKGDSLEFHLVLFGKTIVYFSQFLQAIYQLGTAGLGKEHARYEIVSLTNTLGEDMLDEYLVRMERYRIQRVWDYVVYRAKHPPIENLISFCTPVTLKYQGQIQKKLSLEAIVPAVLRRIYMLDCFEGFECDALHWNDTYPNVMIENSKEIAVRRYSSTQDRRMQLMGIKGVLRLENIPKTLLPILLAGELMHIGKNTSFGFGRYRVK